MPRAPCHWPASGAIRNPNQGGKRCSTGLHVPSSPMHDAIAPRAKGKTPRGSARPVIGPQAVPYSIQSGGGGDGCSTGPRVASNPMHDPIAPRPKGRMPGGSAPPVIGPQAGPYLIQSGGGMGAVQTPMCPLTPCMTPLQHVPRGRRPVGARPLSLAPKWRHIPSNRGGEWVQYGPPCAL